ncbi:aldehyde dehydrogenase family protein [Vagococcus vulneris]|uniref:Aldehyde dehydrogenase n=1 Tax=Vagococcus vulneris TaxID=1977869 RepID=A0A429ZZA7_9ENTE|nr:aldehyde dehydrogenase family protein [Vagococcus vulneris]RST99345.1 hypothetical protein CBF37_05080 [Vagococcus vulneris]
MYKSIVRHQRDYFRTGQTLSLVFRKNQLIKLKRQLQNYEAELLIALKKDLHKSETEAYLSEIGILYRHLDQMIKNLKKWTSPKKVGTPFFLQPAKSEILREPYGVSLIIGPFNYPVLLVFDPLIGAIATGNTAVIGLSSSVPHTNRVIQEMLGETFEKKYVVSYISDKVSNEQILNEVFDKIFFTGSEKVGKIFAKQAAENMTPITLELGGKSPAIVTKYSDIELAAQRLVWGKFLNAGQTCVAPDYCLVDNQVKGQFLEEIRNVIVKQFGETPESSRDFGRLVSEASLKRLVKILEADQDYIWLGGQYGLADRFLEPTVIIGDSADELQCMSEELFGPILPVLGYDKLAEAVNFVRKKPQPLAFYPFSNNKKEINWLIKQISCGGITVNDTILHLANDNLPFGGIGHSGMGTYHGYDSVEAFSHKKSVLRRSQLVNLPLNFPPYTESKNKLIRLFLR